MCELQWYALAEVHLKNQDSSNEIYCLCSRVFVRNKDDNLKRHPSSAEFSASEEELLIEDEVSSECNSLPTIYKNKTKQDVEHETVSCYCSASHTDNLSTDEHDSLRDSHDTSRAPFRGLQSSDSGADLTECVKHDVDSDWQKFWSINGEKFIWESWIAKYSAYISPEYLQYAQDQATDVEPSRPETKFSFDKRDLLTLDIEPAAKLELRTIDENSALPASGSSVKKSDVDVKNRILVRNLSGSDDRLNLDVSEGWNPLSPASVDCETEIEQLLSSRCGSHASSSGRTVDSMTNVTRMTISSIDLSQSSHNSDSFSSVSSVQSSLSSSSSDEVDEEYQHQWNVLWKRHYEDEYLHHYQLYAASWKDLNISDTIVNDKIDSNRPSNADILLNNTSDPTKKNIHKVFQGFVDDDDVKSPVQVNSQVANSLERLMNSLKMSSCESTLIGADEYSRGGDISDCPSMENEESNQMAAMGLPAAFGSGTKRSRIEESGQESMLLAPVVGDFEPCRKRIKAAFKLMGVEFDDTVGTHVTGQVQYKMKHIRLQNRHLKLRLDKKPRHTYFDDDGNVLPSTETPENSVLPDVSDDKLSSADEEIVSNELVTTPPKTEEQTSEEAAVPKRKKRKKKFPQEIRDNACLKKFWYRRFKLFSKFDEGIKLDEESWYSVTPELLAKHIAQRCKCDVIVDGFCGAGGNTIQFAQTCQKVIAIDIDPKKIELARNNAEVYDVADKIEFICGDFFQLVDTLKADVVFFSPPWGGPSYKKELVYDLEKSLLPVPISQLLEAGRKITSNIAVFLPKNSNSFLLIDPTKPGGGVEIEQNVMNQTLVAITAYYSDLIKKIPI